MKFSRRMTIGWLLLLVLAAAIGLGLGVAVGSRRAGDTPRGVFFRVMVIAPLAALTPVALMVACSWRGGRGDRRGGPGS